MTTRTSRPDAGRRATARTRGAASKKAVSRKAASKKAVSTKAASKKAASTKAGPRRSTATTRSSVGSRTTTARRSGSASGRGADRQLQVSGFRTSRSRAERRASTGSGRRRQGRRRSTARTPVTDAGERNAAFLTATVVGLTLFGLVMVLSASSVSSLHELEQSPFFQFKRQAMWAGIGAVAFVVTSHVDYRRWRPLTIPVLAVVTGLLVLLLVPGVGINVNGSTRWLGYGPVVIQPSELAKLVFILFAADLLARRERRMDRPELTVRPVMLVLMLLSALIVLQPKLGTPIIMAGVAFLVLFVAGARLRHLAGWLALAAAGAGALAYAADYRRARLLSFLDPWADPQGNGLQVIQSQIGISSGGLFGVGLGASRAKWGFLPYAHTDFIFAVVAEEVGLLGASALIGGFLLIAWFGFRAAMAAPDRYGTLLASGITAWLLIQVSSTSAW